MGVEIERKFLVTSAEWRAACYLRETICQGYLSTTDAVGVRVRISDEVAFLTIKSREVGPVREEYEYRIPLGDAQALLKRCRAPLIEKTRHTMAFADRVWTIDEFGGHRAGLVLAECELQSIDDELALPPWIGADVTNDPAYRNEAL
jgi:CYTH domain-containing protein